MRKHILFLTAGFVMSSSVAMAESDYYITPQIGYSYQNNKFDFEPIDRIDAPEITKERFKNSAIYNLTIGKRIYDSTFLELEVAYSPNRRFNKTVSIDGGAPTNYNFSTKLKNISTFVNIKHKFQNILPLTVTPYLLGGIGYSSNKIKNIEIASSENANDNIIVDGKRTNNFAWQLGAGLLFPVTQNLDVDLTYKFRSLGRFKSDYIYRPVNGELFEGDTVVKGRLHSSDVLLGIAIRF